MTVPIEKAGKAFAIGANIALRQKCLGLESSDIAVPLIMTNGQLYTFAAVSLLEYVPVLHVLTDVLDANRPSDLDTIAKMLCRVKRFILRQAIKLYLLLQVSATMPEPRPPFPFDTDKYFLKPCERIFNRFSVHGHPLDEEFGALPLLWDVFEALSDVDGAVKPLGFGQLKVAGEERRRSGAIVFYNIERDGYVTGVPRGQGDYEAFLAALEAVVHEVHARGVIHVDLFPSNIMWARAEGGSVKIRIVDWDAATFVGTQFSSIMEQRLEDGTRSGRHYPSPAACAENDAWHVFLLSGLADADREGMQGAACNEAYRGLTYRRAEERGLRALHQEFRRWFKGHWAGRLGADSDSDGSHSSESSKSAESFESLW
jgi:hypothetical protein